VQYATDINSKLTGIIVRIYVHPYKLRHVIAVRFLFTIFNYYLKKNCVVPFVVYFLEKPNCFLHGLAVYFMVSYQHFLCRKKNSKTVQQSCKVT